MCAAKKKESDYGAEPLGSTAIIRKVVDRLGHEFKEQAPTDKSRKLLSVLKNKIGRAHV